jgi:6-pyruvoyltetrahydropterin/6-carboxytetrahydropterin synthase
MLWSDSLFTLMVETTFTARHQLTIAQGQKEPLHSHDWIVRVGVSADRLDEMGLVVDFDDLKAKIEGVISPFNGARLEELSCFQGVNTSAENVAKYIYDKIEQLLPSHVKPRYVEVAEAPGCRAKYSR